MAALVTASTWGLGTRAPWIPPPFQPLTSRVDGATPLDVKVNAKDQGDDGEYEKGSAVYLQVGEMDTDAKAHSEAGQAR